MQVAFYKGTHSGIPGIYNRVVRWWTNSEFSHVELIFSDGVSASASYMDGGVRFKVIDYNPANWIIFDLPDDYEKYARDWFRKHEGDSYDILGNLHFIISPIKDSKSKWFCSESIAAALGISNPGRFDPGTLHDVLRFITRP